MKRLVALVILVFTIVGCAVGLSYHRLYYPMTATLPGGSGVWEFESLPLNFWSSDVMPDGTTVSATVQEAGKGRVYKSVDEGLTWQFIFEIPESLGAGLTFCDSYGNIYVSAPAQEFTGVAGLWRSADGGVTFQKVWEAEPAHRWGNIRFKGMCEVDGILYFGESVYSGGNCDVFRSTDQGVTWTKISTISGGKHIHALQYNPYNGWFYASVGDAGYSANGLWRSKDNCLTWEKFNLPDWTIMSVGFYNDYVFCNIHHEQGQIRRFRDTGGLSPSWEEVYRTGMTYQNWCQLYQRSGKTFMLAGGENGDVGVWGSDTPPFNSGTWQKYWNDSSGSGGTVAPSLKTSLNGWLFVASTIEGQGIRLRYSAPVGAIKHCDVVEDGIINMQDIYAATLAYMRTPEDSSWNPRADVIQDNVINMLDIYQMILHFMEDP